MSACATSSSSKYWRLSASLMTPVMFWRNTWLPMFVE
jgi:hypothetical protein